MGYETKDKYSYLFLVTDKHSTMPVDLKGNGKSVPYPSDSKGKCCAKAYCVLADGV